MKTDTIAQALRLCKSSLLSIDFVPILTHFCFLDDVVYAYNDISAVVVQLPTGLMAGIKGETLLGVLPTLGEEVEIAAGKEGVINLTSGKIKLKLAAMPHTAFLFEPPAEEPCVILNASKAVLRGLARVVTTVGQNAMHREFTGVTVERDKDNSINVYSTDDIRLSRLVLNEDDVVIENRKRTRWLIPAQTVRQLIEVCTALGDTEGDRLINLGEDWLIFEGPGVSVYSKLMPETPPDYKGMVAQVMPPDDAWQKLPEAAVVAFKRAEVLTSKETQPKLLAKSVGKVLRLEVEGDNALGSFTEDVSLQKANDMGAYLSVDPGKAREAAEATADLFALVPRCLGFKSGSYCCLVAPLKSE